MGRVGGTAVSYALAIAGTIAMSAVIAATFSFIRIANISILYLIVVLAAATMLGRGPAIAASLASFLIYDWFFTDPRHTLTVADPAEWLSLVLFLATAVLTSELAANARGRAEEALRREREAVLLFDALRLLGDPDVDRALTALAERLRTELRVRSVAISLTLAGKDHAAVAGDRETLTGDLEVLGVGRRPTATEPGGPARWIRVVPPAHVERGGPRAEGLRRSEVAIKSASETVGRVALIRDAASTWTPADARAIALIAGSIGSVVERANLRDATTRAEILRRTDELRSALLAAVSHDLRTPLASIIASAGSLRQPDVQWTDAERRAFVADIEHEARRLSRIVDNLLDLSRIEAGALRPDRGWYDISALIDDVVGRLRPITFAHPVDLDVPDDLPPVHLDYVEIDQVLTNLIENAVRHTRPGTAIHVSARVAGGALEVAVADRGPGIEPRAMSRLFDPFVRGTAATHGSGLGLAVARGLVEAHGGEIHAENGADGGAVFRFTLPLGEHAAAGRA